MTVQLDALLTDIDAVISRTAYGCAYTEPDAVRLIAAIRAAMGSVVVDPIAELRHDLRRDANDFEDVPHPADGGASDAERVHGMGFRIVVPPTAPWDEDPWASRPAEARREAAAMRSRVA